MTALAVPMLAAVAPAPSVARIGACQGCGACLLTCPEHAIRPSAGLDRALVVTAACTGCGECVEICPVDVIELFPIGAS